MQRNASTVRSPSLRQRTFIVASSLVIALALAHGSAKAQPAPTLPSTNTIAIPTYEAVGLYWQSPGGAAGCEVKYRAEGETAWKQGLAMWYDARDTQCRGSLVSLAPNTYYQVEFNLPAQPATRGLVFKTWANQVPVAQTISVASADGTTLNITQGGTAAGYVVYEGNGAILDAQNLAQYNVSVNASYVVVRGFNLKGAKQDAVRISPNVSNVIVEDNDISGWGRTRDGTWGTDMDSGVRAVCTTPTLTRVTIQRNKIHDPRYSANSWSDGHPMGPQAVSFSYCGGNHVIRHNEMYSTNGKYYNDVIGGEDNFTTAGFPNSDTDIYGNVLSHGWDDAIEAEGANENVRIWGNYMDRTAVGVATTVTSIGPAYVFRNVWNRSQFYAKIASLDQDDRGPFFKSGSDASLGFGRRYFFHNTMLQATQAGLLYGLGGGNGMTGSGDKELITNTWSMNNIYHLWKPQRTAFWQTGGSGTQIANDMYNGALGDATIVNGINATPVYAPSHGWQSEAGGQYQLDAASPGFAKGIKLANFNDDAATPDVGAHQSGSAAMRFGLAASPGPAVGPVAPPPPPPSTFALGVSRAGSGTGVVSSAPAGIDCGATCSADFANGALVTLAATAAPDSVFAGWSGACSGMAACTVTMDAAKTVAATFNPIPPVVVGELAMSVSSLVFGSTQSTQSVTYTNNTSSTVTFIQGVMSSAKFGQTNTCTDLAPGATCTAQVTFYPQYAGALTGTFTATSSAPNSPHVVTLQGTPPPAIVTQSTTALTFPAVQTTRSVIFTNQTGVTVTFRNPSVTSSKFKVSNGCGTVLAGKSCTVNITFTPRNKGVVSGTFSIQSTAPNSPHTVKLN
ncbi:MAG TPA: choice-of-anchor D domain-containing protein [Usitatibacter sp.]|nr:choice-of-anchor D domain-containing protein [Usitatibacter sp.]